MQHNTNMTQHSITSEMHTFVGEHEVSYMCGDVVVRLVRNKRKYAMRITYYTVQLS